ncbi:hypothetical protein [Cellulomonas sp. Root137]|uniref:hypothetical protein n=1 Tax=Cellulomonas sp. Root137 TaxID=1736459 RepID=UPI0007004BB5|nr:hypothetical protein [Cellulomonas sp. Root137]KQY47455.1 hypothetical protein ASD18_09000 [Cellulomonas sp. Root137]
MRRTTTTAAAAVVLIPLLVGTAGAPAFAADSGDVAVTNTETVQARLSATGAFQSARVYEQLALSGTGTTTIENPVSTKGLRNLDGFGGYQVTDGKLVSTLSVDGERRERSLSTYDKDLPLAVEVTYTFDGKAVQPGAVVGKSGTLGVHYKVTNVTGATQDVTYDDGTGTQATASAQTVIPMIGQLVTVLPSTFTDVQSDEAGIAGDGRGGTRMQFQMTLFPPIGSATAEFGYTAQVSHAVVPKATLTSMAVSPLDYPSFKGGAASYQAGAQKGVDLTGAGLLLDDSVLQLHDGAAQLLAGLLQLRDGAAKLESGLNDEAAPGAAELADGLNDQIAPGAAKLAAGLNDQIAPGAAKLAAGLNDKLAPGAAKLAGGLGEAAPGAAALASGLTTQLAPGAATLAAGAGALNAGLAEASSKAPALLAGLVQVGSGLDLVDAGLAKLYGDIGTLPTQAQGLHDGITQLRTATSTLTAGIDQVRTGVSGAAASASTLSGGAVSLGNQLSVGVGALTSLRAGMDPAYLAQYDAVIAQLSGGVPVLTDTTDPATIAGGAAALSQGLAGAATNLTKIECGLSSASLPGVCDASKKGVLEGLADVDAGITLLVNGVVAKVQTGVGDADDTSADNTLRGGVHSLQAGTSQLNAGGATLATGLTALGAGASQLNAGASTLSGGLAAAAAGSQKLSVGLAPAATGSQEISAGLNEAAAGSQKLSDGLAPAVSGSKDLSAGVAKAAAGSTRLSAGLGDAADGSTQLSDGLVSAADGAPKLVDGTQQLSDEGTSQVVVSGKGTAEDFGVKYAVLSAQADRASAEGMAYGAPDGAAGFTAYSIDIAGVDGTGASSVGRLIAAIALFAAGIGLATFARRRFV